MLRPLSLRRYLILFPMLLLTITAQSAELNVRIKDTELSLSVSDINYPEHLLEKELKSGLPNDISLLVAINQDGKKVFVTRLNYQITYDLWDEIYQVRTTSSTIKSATQAAKPHHELVTLITQIRLSSKDAVRHLQTDAKYQVTAQVLVNPVKKERIDKIRNWIAESQGYVPVPEEQQGTRYAERSASAPQRSAPQGANAAAIINPGAGGDRVAANRPRFQKLFDQILEQYMDEDEVPALWHSELLTHTIQLKRKKSEK